MIIGRAVGTLNTVLFFIVGVDLPLQWGELSGILNFSRLSRFRWRPAWVWAVCCWRLASVLSMTALLVLFLGFLGAWLIAYLWHVWALPDGMVLRQVLLHYLPVTLTEWRQAWEDDAQPVE